MEKKIALIFDCDGTIVDSYDSIVDWIDRTFKHFGVSEDKKRIRELAISHFVDFAYKTIAEEHGLSFDEVRSFSKNVVQNIDLITLYPNLFDVLNNPRFVCFIYTHRGKTCKDLFAKLGVDNSFKEIVTSLNGFKKKPDPEGVEYLINKYDLDKEHTYYIGDRLLDIECGINAGVKTIFFNSSSVPIDDSKATFKINDLIDINHLNL